MRLRTKLESCSQTITRDLAKQQGVAKAYCTPRFHLKSHPGALFKLQLLSGFRDQNIALLGHKKRECTGHEEQRPGAQWPGTRSCSTWNKIVVAFKLGSRSYTLKDEVSIGFGIEFDKVVTAWGVVVRTSKVTRSNRLIRACQITRLR